MSHVAKIDLVVKDLEALKAAVKELGLHFKENQKTYGWWGTSVGGYPLPKGITKDDLGKCDHAIAVNGTTWEIGVFKLRDGSGFALLYDFFGSQGQPIANAIGGNDGKRLKDVYCTHKVMMEARRRGQSVQRTNERDGTIRLRITGMR